MADKPWLRLHKEFQASALKFLVRRDQMNKVETLIQHNHKFLNDASTSQKLHATDLEALVRQKGRLVRRRAFRHVSRAGSHEERRRH